MQTVTARLKNNDHPTGHMMAGGKQWGVSWRTHELSDANAEIVLNHNLLDIKGIDTAPDAPAATKAPAADKPDRKALQARAKELGLKTGGKNTALVKAIAAEEEKRADAVAASAPAKSADE